MNPATARNRLLVGEGELEETITEVGAAPIKKEKRNEGKGGQEEVEEKGKERWTGQAGEDEK